MASILIVDDEASVRAFLQTLLAPKGHRLLEASDAEQGLSLVRQEQPDLVITDVVMPGMDGFEFIRQLRAQEMGGNTPVIIHTGYMTCKNARDLAKAYGVQFLIEKPSSSSALLNAVATCLSSSHPPVDSTILNRNHDREHFELLADKLHQKIQELEAANLRLAQEAAERRRYQDSLERAQVQAKVGSWEFNPIQQSGWWSNEMYHLFDRARTLGPPAPEEFLEEVHPDDRQGIIDASARCLQTGQFDRHEFRSNPQRGPLRYFVSVAERALADDGTSLLVGTTQDISERRRAEESLRASEAKYRAIFDHAVEGMFRTSPAGVFLDLNPALARIYGYASVAEALANLTNIGRQLYVDPTLRDEFMRRIEAEGTVSGFEFAIHRRDGSVAWVREYARCVRDGAGNVVCYEGTVEDITERRRTETERAQLAAIIESTPDFVSICDPDLKFRYLNRAVRRALGVADDENITQLTGRDFRAPADLGQYVNEIVPAVVRDGFWSGETNWLARDGRVIPISQVVIAHQSAAGVVESYSAVARDITELKRTEEAYRQSEGQMRLFMEATADSLWNWDLITGNVVRSSGFQRIFGYSEEEMNSSITWWEERLHPDDRGKVVSTFHGTVAGGGNTCSYEYRFRRKDGNYAIINDHAYVVRDARGKPLRALGAMTDITDRKQAVEALREASEFNRQIVTSAREGIVVYDRDLCYLVWNPFMEQWSGKTAAEVLGRHPWDVFPFLKAFNMESQLRRALAGETVTLPDVLNPVDLEGGPRWASPTLFPLRSATGEITGVINFVKDITERKRAERNILESQERFAGVVNTAMDAIITVDVDQRVVLFNHAAETMFGYRATEMLGQPLDRLLPERFRPMHSRHIQAFGTTGVTSRAMNALGAVSAVRANGDEFPVEASIAQNGEGPGKLFTVILRDITERKQAEEVIRQSNQRLQVLSRKVLEIQETERRHLAHELHDEIGQVLSAISVNLKVVKGKVDPQAWPRLEESISMVDRAVQQVRDLSLDLRPAILDDFGLEAALRWYVNRMGERTALACTFTAESSVLDISYAVRTACFRTVQEALTNIVRHSRAREVRVTLQAEDEEVRLIIQDDGRGFDVALAQQRAARGGSLGLLGMQERVTLLGGNMEIESQPGRGTMIRVRMPLAQHATSEEADKDGDTHAPNPSNPGG